MRAVYTGHEALTFTDYTDLGTGRTLHAVPGGVYDVVPASGRLVADLPAGWFTPAYDAGMPAAEPEPEPEPEPEAEAGEQQPEEAQSEEDPQ